MSVAKQSFARSVTVVFSEVTDDNRLQVQDRSPGRRNGYSELHPTSGSARCKVITYVTHCPVISSAALTFSARRRRRLGSVRLHIAQSMEFPDATLTVAEAVTAGSLELQDLEPMIRLPAFCLLSAILSAESQSDASPPDILEKTPRIQHRDQLIRISGEDHSSIVR